MATTTPNTIKVPDYNSHWVYDPTSDRCRFIGSEDQCKQYILRYPKQAANANWQILPNS